LANFVEQSNQNPCITSIWEKYQGSVLEQRTNRLYFIDAIRAWAILMMLQGHFIDGLLDPLFRDNTNMGYSLWKYFRGITAPVFFTVSGFIFTYLLIRVPQKGLENPRVKKGIKRGLELLAIGYILRLNLGGLLQGKLYDAFFFVDVLHCIGISLLVIVSVYLVTYSKRLVLFPAVLLSLTLLLFILEPLYAATTFNGLPDAFANYLTRANGSVFTIIPWVGYTTFGAFGSLLFTKHKEGAHFYPRIIAICLTVGALLIFTSSDFFVLLTELTGIPLFAAISLNNYLFIRLGDVVLAFAVFMLLRKWLTNLTFLKIGQSTLSIYVTHFIILYGSFTGVGLYRFFHHSLSPTVTIIGAVVFMTVCSFIALRYEKHKKSLKQNIRNFFQKAWSATEPLLKTSFSKVRDAFLKLFGLVKN
jgi:hypothetical protein